MLQLFVINKSVNQTVTDENDILICMIINKTHDHAFYEMLYPAETRENLYLTKIGLLQSLDCFVS